MISSGTVGLRRVGPAVVAALVPVLLSGCEAEAVELVREIEAARGECTREGLRASDEECVRMMERYTSMGTELVHTYLGGLRALDIALDRLPSPGFDTAGMGYAISPELREGDPTGSGGSPRLLPQRAAYTYGSTAGTLGETRSWRSDARAPRPAADPAARRPAARPGAGGYDGYADGWTGQREYYDRRDPSRRFRDAEYGRDHGGRARDRYRRDDRGDYYFDRYGRYGPSTPFGPGGFSPFGLDWAAPFGDWPYSPFGYDSPYGSGGYGRYPYVGYGPWDGYASGAGAWSGGGWNGGGGYDPYGRSPGYDPYARPYIEDDYGRYAPSAPPPEYDDRPPAEAWGYDDATGGDGAGTGDAPAATVEDPAADARPGRTAAPSRPATHRPGILLPPEERLRRPWLDD